MDIEFIKEKIYHTDEQKKIQPGECLSADVIKILRDGNIVDRAACFAPIGDTKDLVLFQSEITCSKCNQPITKDLTKTGLLAYLKNTKTVLCDDCEIKVQNEKCQEAAQKLIDQERYKQKIIRITDDYIVSYLNPLYKWDKDLPAYARQELIIGRRDVDYDKVSQYIKSMSYKDFLQTMYWETISSYKKYKENYKCALCGSSINLATHHKTYERHGYEHLYQVINEDLIVLCKDCHSKFHNKL